MLFNLISLKRYTEFNEIPSKNIITIYNYYIFFYKLPFAFWNFLPCFIEIL